MFETKITESTQVKTQSKIVTNPMHVDLPKTTEISDKEQTQYRIINSIMFIGLAAIAVTIFYKAVMSLML